MRKVNLLFCVLLQPIWLCAQTTLSLASPSETLNADIQEDEKYIQITLFDKGEKVLDTKTLQLELDKNILSRKWQVANQTRNVADQT